MNGAVGGSVSNLSLGSENGKPAEPARPTRSSQNSPCVSNHTGFLSPDLYTNHIELRRLRAAST